MKIDRREFLRICGGIGALATSGCSDLDVRRDKPRLIVPVDINEAKEYEDKRQLFLDYLADLLDMPEVEGVFYDPKCDKHKDYLIGKDCLRYLIFEIFTPDKEKEGIVRKRNSRYANVVFFPCRIGKKEKHPMFVQTAFFEKDSYITGENEAISLIRDHEYFHVLDYYNGIVIGDMIVDHRNVHLMENFDNLEFLLEARAYHNQVVNSIRKDATDGKIKYGRKINVEMFEDITESYVKYCKMLMGIGKGKDFKAEACRRQLELFQDMGFKEDGEKITLIYRDKT